MLILASNIFLYLLPLLYFKTKDKDWNLFNFLLLYYVIIAIMGVLTLYNGQYEQTFGSKESVALSFVPYLLCFLSYFIFFYPFRDLSQKVDIEMPNIKYINFFISLWIIVMLSYGILKYVEASITVSIGFSQAYELRHMEGESIFDYSDNIILKRLRNLGLILQECTVPLIMLYCIDCVQKKKNSLLVVFLVALCFLPNFLSAIALAARGSIFSTAVKMLFFFFLFQQFITRQQKRFCMIVGVLMVVAMAFYSFSITESRLETKEHSETPIESISRYFGESFPNLGYSFWDRVKYHPMGERLFPELYGYTKKERFGSTAALHDYWGEKTNVPVLNFKTLFGDLYIEFGTLGALIFIILFSFVFKQIMHGGINYVNIGIAFQYFQICCMGFAGVTQLSGPHLVSWAIIFMLGYTLKKMSRKTKSSDYRQIT